MTKTETDENSKEIEVFKQSKPTGFSSSDLEIESMEKLKTTNLELEKNILDKENEISWLNDVIELNKKVIKVYL